jgi:hypothetical protein
LCNRDLISVTLNKKGKESESTPDVYKDDDKRINGEILSPSEDMSGEKYSPYFYPCKVQKLY